MRVRHMPIGSEAYNTSLNEINGVLSSKLESVYKKILQQMPNAKVYVAGYPQVIANKQSTDPSDSRCAYMHGGDWGDAQAARDIVTKLNQKIQQKVNDVRRMDSGFNNRIFYIPLDGDDSPFKGHEMCGTASSSWFHNIDQAVYDESYAFHPNKMGQEGYATVIASTINAVT